jgi:hypothetical protein
MPCGLPNFMPGSNHFNLLFSGNQNKKMKEVTLKRFSNDTKQTLGVLTLVKDDGQLFVCKTLELPWKNNASNVSCIPVGSYTCKYTRSNRMSAQAGHDVFTYEVLNVPSRAGVRIHSANFFSQLLGCVALGDAHKDINNDQELDVIHSGNTIAAFENVLQKKDFRLIISDC